MKLTVFRLETEAGVGMAAIHETHYSHVWVRRMEDDGSSAMVYPNTVAVSTVYDPKVKVTRSSNRPLNYFSIARV